MGEVLESEYDAVVSECTATLDDLTEHDYERLPTQSVYVHMAAGSAAGIMEHTVMYPIDLVKTRLQSLCPCPEQSCRTPVHGVISIAKREGLLRPLRGVNAIALGAAPAHALYFSLYEKLKRILTGGYVGHHQTWAYGVAGIAATVVHDGVMNPAEVVKQRMQMCGSPYCSIFDCAKCIFRQEGISAFYRSYLTQLSLNIPFQCCHFMAYEFASHSLNPSHTYDPKTHLLAGAFGGGMAAALTTPFDVVKTVLNTQQGPGTPAAAVAPKKLSTSSTAAAALLWQPIGTARGTHTEPKPVGYCPAGYRGIHDAIRGIYRTRGLVGFVSGFQARVLTQIPATAISWSVYEFFKYLLSKQNDDFVTC